MGRSCSEKLWMPFAAINAAKYAVLITRYGIRNDRDRTECPQTTICTITDGPQISYCPSMPAYNINRAETTRLVVTNSANTS